LKFYDVSLPLRWFETHCKLHIQTHCVVQDDANLTGIVLCIGDMQYEYAKKISLIFQYEYWSKLAIFDTLLQLL